MDLFVSKQYMHPHAIANILDRSVKATWKLCVRLMPTVDVFGIDPTGVLAQ